LREKQALEPKFRDLELKYIHPSGPPLDDDEPGSLIQGAIRNIRGLSENIFTGR
jgi:hypothetical protein